MPMENREWKCPRQGFKYTPAMGCPFCNGKMIYVADKGSYYLGGHMDKCLFFGRGLEFNSFEEMEKYWETRNDSR